MPNIGALRDMIHRHDGESPEETQTPAGEGTTPPPAPSTALAGRQMTAPEQAKALAKHGLRYAWRRFHNARTTDGGLTHFLFNYQARSVHGQADYARSRRWVPAGHEGGVTEELGMAYHKWVALPGTVILQAAGAIQHPSIFLLYIVLPLAAIFIPVALLLMSAFGIVAGFFAAAGVVAVVVILLAVVASAALISKGSHRS